jgi:transposase
VDVHGGHDERILDLVGVCVNRIGTSHPIAALLRYLEKNVCVKHGQAQSTWIAAHARISSNYQHTTVREHMPSHHRKYADWTPERLRRQASQIGPNAGTLVEVIMRERRHPEQGFRACLGIVRLAKMHGSGRLDAACERALEINARSYASVKSILNNNLERRRRERATDGPAITHPNIRGAKYFH